MYSKTTKIPLEAKNLKIVSMDNLVFSQWFFVIINSAEGKSKIWQNIKYKKNKMHNETTKLFL
jgi:hypothetical protein